MCFTLRLKLRQLGIEFKQLDTYLFPPEMIEAYDDHDEISLYSLKEVL